MTKATSKFHRQLTDTLITLYSILILPLGLGLRIFFGHITLKQSILAKLKLQQPSLKRMI